jgi:hypothetical protein
MGPGLVILISIVGVTAVIVFAIMTRRIEARRRDALSALTERLGFSFDPERHSPDAGLEQFPLFLQGHSRVKYNTMLGAVPIHQRSYDVQMGDFIYKITRSEGKVTSTTTHEFSYVMIRLPFRAVPDLLIRREGVLDKIAGALGFDDIDFESETFSRRFCVKSSDKKFAYDVINPKMIEFLMAGNPPAIHLVGGAMCLTDGSRRWEPAEFESRLDWLKQFFALWPEYLTEQLDGGPAASTRPTA